MNVKGTHIQIAKRRRGSNHLPRFVVPVTQQEAVGNFHLPCAHTLHAHLHEITLEVRVREDLEEDVCGTLDAQLSRPRT
jgi:hypothetical protein